MFHVEIKIGNSDPALEGFGTLPGVAVFSGAFLTPSEIAQQPYIGTRAGVALTNFPEASSLDTDDCCALVIMLSWALDANSGLPPSSSCNASFAIVPFLVWYLQGQVYAWGHNRVAQLGIGNSFTVPRNGEGACFLPSPQLVESLLGKVRSCCCGVEGPRESRRSQRCWHHEYPPREPVDGSLSYSYGGQMLIGEAIIL